MYLSVLSAPQKAGHAVGEYVTDGSAWGLTRQKGHMRAYTCFAQLASGCADICGQITADLGIVGDDTCPLSAFTGSHHYSAAGPSGSG